MNIKPTQEYDHKSKLEHDIHFTIDQNGSWYFHGGKNPGPMHREALVKLFADKALKFKDGKYFLATPFESYEVDVEDVPFMIVDFEETEQGEIKLFTNIGDEITLNKERKIFLRAPAFTDIELPYIEVRKGLNARLSQRVRDAFIEKALEQNNDLEEGDILFFNLNDVMHPIAKWDE